MYQTARSIGCASGASDIPAEGADRCVECRPELSPSVRYAHPMERSFVGSPAGLMTVKQTWLAKP